MAKYSRIKFPFPEVIYLQLASHEKIRFSCVLSWLTLDLILYILLMYGLHHFSYSIGFWNETCAIPVPWGGQSLTAGAHRGVWSLWQWGEGIPPYAGILQATWKLQILGSQSSKASVQLWKGILRGKRGNRSFVKLKAKNPSNCGL